MPTKNTEKSNGAIKNTVHPVADKFADSLHSTVDSIHGTAASTEETLRAKGTQSNETIKAQTRLLRSKWNQSPVKKYAYENPVKTAGIAFTAGMLLTMFLRKK